MEIIGRNYLVSQLLRDGVEVARPERDRGVDIVAYLDLDDSGGPFTACPIQMKAATNRSFGVARKYEKFSRLLLAYVWGASDPNEATSFCLTFQEAAGVAQEMGWTETASWAREGYNTNNPSKRLMSHLEPFRMGPGDWKVKIRLVGSEHPAAAEDCGPKLLR